MTGSFSALLSAVFDELAECTIEAGLLILLVLTVRILLGRRLAGRWLYALWLLVVVRLALPWLPQVTWSPFGWLPRFQAPAPAARVLPDPVAGASLPQAPGDFGPFSPAATPFPDTGHLAADRVTPVSIVSQCSSAWTVRHGFYLIWLGGIVALGSYTCAGFLRFRRSIAGLPPLADPAVLELLEECKRRMGVRTAVPVVVTSRTASPALFGFLRPRLLMPPAVLNSLSREELRHVFLHELAHLRRRDVPVGCLICIVQILHWCNPLVWLAAGRMRADRELACDTLALEGLGGREPGEYGRTIIRLLEHFARPQYLPALTGILEDKHRLTRRITMIARFKGGRTGNSLLGTVLLLIIGCAALTDAPADKAATVNPAGSPVATVPPEPGSESTFDAGVDYVIEPGKGLDIITVGATPDRIRAVFGEPEGRDGSGGVYRLIYHKAAHMDFLLSEAENRAIEIRFNRGFDGRTVQGIRIGSSLEEVLAAGGGANKTVNASRDQTHGCAFGQDRVLYVQRGWLNLPAAYKFIDAKRGILYWLDSGKKVVQIVVFGTHHTKAGADTLTPADLPEGSRIDEHGNIVDRLDWPYVPDPQAAGKWETVDFVKRMEDFKPGKPNWPADKLYLKGLVLEEGGKANFGFATWTKGRLMFQGDRVSPQYTIREIDGTPYMFFEWKSGDYSIRHQRPHYYVLKKLPTDTKKLSGPRDLFAFGTDRPEVKPGADSRIDENDRIVDKVDYPFVEDPQVSGTSWEAVDFVKDIGQFKPDQTQWKGELFLKELQFLPDGRMKPWDHWTWTKGLVLSRRNQTASKYEIKNMRGQTYLFFEWKSGDYTVLHRKPAWYVLKKAD